jgi:hypothetical protein
MLGDKKLQVATNCDCCRRLATNSDDTGSKDWGEAGFVNGGAEYWNIKEGGAASRDLSGKSDAMKVLRYGAF